MRAFYLLPLLGLSLLGLGCAHGRYVNVDPIYEPVQQVHQNFYRAPDFDWKNKKVAVMDFKGSKGEGQVFADTFASQLFGLGVQVVERQNMEVLLREIKMAQAGKQNLTDTEILQKIGQIHGVDVVMVGGVVSYNEKVGQNQVQQNITLPFLVWEWEMSEADKGAEMFPPENSVIYRWKPDSYKNPAGLPVHATVYASARGIEVATGRIVWINTVNVSTSGITQITGLERLGMVMAGNYTGSFNDRVQLYIYDGSKFTYPANWEEVQSAWKRVLAREQSMGIFR